MSGRGHGRGYGRMLAVVALGLVICLGSTGGGALEGGAVRWSVGVARADVLDDAWKRGNDAYLRGDFAAAVTAYEQLEQQGVVSSELAYNLGNAYYRRGQLGRAIWAWERTLDLDAAADDARYNLAQARKVVGRRVHDKLEGADRDPLWVRAVTELSLSTETWLFLAFYLSFFVVLVVRAQRLGANRAGDDDPPAWGAVAAVLGVGAALAAALLVGRVALDRVPFGVVLADEVPVKEGADPNYRTTFEVHAGLRVRMLDRDQNWVRIRLANGLEGWVGEGDIGRL